jgi:tRNA(adenine34) deaminase
MTPEEMVGEALAVAAEGLAAGEHPIGAVVVLGDEVVGRAHTSEKTAGRRLVHADLLAMTQADATLGWRRRAHLWFESASPGPMRDWAETLIKGHADRVA